MKKYLLITVIMTTMLFTGCATLKDLYDKYKDDTKPPVEEVEEVVEDLDISKVKWLGANYSSAQMEVLLNSASMNKNTISTSYKPYDWPVVVVKVKVDAICCIFYEKGSDIVGGKFDWWREGGQGSKTLENVHHGYQGHTWPEVGAKVWTCIVSVDGKKRSNLVSVERK